MSTSPLRANGHTGALCSLECGPLEFLCFCDSSLILFCLPPAFMLWSQILWLETVAIVIGASIHGAQRCIKKEKVGWCHCSSVGWEQPLFQAWAALGWHFQEMRDCVESTKQVLMLLFKLSCFQNSLNSLGKAFPVAAGSLQEERIN